MEVNQKMKLKKKNQATCYCKDDPGVDEMLRMCLGAVRQRIDERAALLKPDARTYKRKR